MTKKCENYKFYYTANNLSPDTPPRLGVEGLKVAPSKKLKGAKGTLWLLYPGSYSDH